MGKLVIENQNLTADERGRNADFGKKLGLSGSSDRARPFEGAIVQAALGDAPPALITPAEVEKSLGPPQFIRLYPSDYWME